MLPTTITGVTAGQVRDWLNRVLPHRGTDDTLPFLTRVEITVADGHLIAAATDRYTLAAADLPADTGSTRVRFTVPGDWAEELAAELPDGSFAHAEAQITVTDTAITLDVEALVYAGTDELCYDGDQFTTIPDWQGWPWAWQNAARDLLAAPADPQPVQVPARTLARFAIPNALTLDPAAPAPLAALTAGPDTPPLAVHHTSDPRLIALLGPGFLGLLHAWRPRPDHAHTPEPVTTDPEAWRRAWTDLLTADSAPVPA